MIQVGFILFLLAYYTAILSLRHAADADSSSTRLRLSITRARENDIVGMVAAMFLIAPQNYMAQGTREKKRGRGLMKRVGKTSHLSN